MDLHPHSVETKGAPFAPECFQDSIGATPYPHPDLWQVEKTSPVGVRESNHFHYKLQHYPGCATWSWTDTDRGTCTT